MTSKRKTGPSQAAAKRRRRRRNERWDNTFSRRFTRAVGKLLTDDTLQQAYHDALFPRLLYRKPAEPMFEPTLTTIGPVVPVVWRT